MAGYVIADVRVTDEAGFADFAAGVPASIERHGGKYIIRGGDPEVRQGDWAPPRIVVVEFDNADAARAGSTQMTTPSLRRSSTARPTRTSS